MHKKYNCFRFRQTFDRKRRIRNVFSDKKKNSSPYDTVVTVSMPIIVVINVYRKLHEVGIMVEGRYNRC